MNKLQRRQYEMLRTVHTFCTHNNDLFPPGSMAREALDSISSGFAELGKLGVDQFSGFALTRAKTNAKTLGRKALLANLNRIIKTAKFIAATVAGFDESFKLPRSESDSALLYHARVIADRAAPSAELFVKFSMPLDFIADLNTQIRDIEQAIDERAQTRKHLKHTTAAIAVAMKKCMIAVQQMDVAMTNMLRGQPGKRAEWEMARHVQRARHNKRAISSAENTSNEEAASETENLVMDQVAGHK